MKRHFRCDHVTYVIVQHTALITILHEISPKSNKILSLFVMFVIIVITLRRRFMTIGSIELFSLIIEVCVDRSIKKQEAL